MSADLEVSVSCDEALTEEEEEEVAKAIKSKDQSEMVL